MYTLHLLASAQLPAVLGPTPVLQDVVSVGMGSKAGGPGGKQKQQEDKDPDHLISE
jgi:hypothetical protein